MKVLCLHGAGTNSRIFQLQTAAIRFQLEAENHDYEFVDGTVSWPPAPELKQFLSSSDDECLAYYEKNIDSVRLALQDLFDFIDENGPFDAVLGFSQGASLAASFLVRYGQASSFEPCYGFKCAIFICAVNSVHSGEGRILSGQEDGEMIQIPTVHIVGSKDPFLQESLGLTRICDHRRRIILDHKGGHEIPRGNGTVLAMAACISKALETASLLQ